jgi:hypothetical protein
MVSLFLFYKMNKIQEIEDVFAIFHDGWVVDGIIEGNNIQLKIGIQYLAEIINNKYEYFYFNLFDVEEFKFKAWSKEEILISDWETIVNSEIEFLSTEIKNNKIIIYSNCHNAPDDKFERGELWVKCTDYCIFDEKGKEISLNRLKEISSYYWNEVFGKK